MVGEVRYQASQPWPFPSSLMIGCMAQALGEAITVDRSELEDVRWFPRETVLAALADPSADVGFFVPPPMAIAHHLISLGGIESLGISIFGQRSITTASPALRARSAAGSFTTPSWVQTAFARTAIASSITAPAASEFRNTSTRSIGSSI